VKIRLAFLLQSVMLIAAPAFADPQQCAWEIYQQGSLGRARFFNFKFDADQARSVGFHKALCRSGKRLKLRIDGRVCMLVTSEVGEDQIVITLYHEILGRPFPQTISAFPLTNQYWLVRLEPESSGLSYMAVSCYAPDAP
jgi:hypothetical protein